MKFFLGTVFLLASLAPPLLPAQSASNPANGANRAEIKQLKKDQKAKAKAAKAQKETSKTANADAGKKTSSAQDAAYAGAYKSGIPK